MKIAALGISPVNKSNYNVKANTQPAFKSFINVRTTEPLNPSDIDYFAEEILMTNVHVKDISGVIRSIIKPDDHALISVFFDKKFDQKAIELVEELKGKPETKLCALDVSFDETSCIPSIL